jgi:hypothetical protein
MTLRPMANGAAAVRHGAGKEDDVQALARVLRLEAEPELEVLREHLVAPWAVES